jgi:UDP-hydrolysing UDP-N-acetyl-D-glucosamine 2-epimerase
MRTIGVVTAARSDYGIYRPLLGLIDRDPELRLALIACGMHMSPEFGLTVRDIEADGFVPDERIDMLVSSDGPAGTALSMGLGICGFAQALRRLKPDILVVLGDRYEMFAAAAASVPFLIPLAHIHGGERTEGAIDEQFRHAITKMSHLHFAATEEYGRRLAQMGEEPWRICVSGAPGLDGILAAELPGRGEMLDRLGTDLTRPTLLVTFHPVTREVADTGAQVREVLAALDGSGLDVLMTCPNADPAGREIMAMLQDRVSTRPHWRLVPNLGSRLYYGAMRYCAAMVGNSSSGIIEAPSFALPVVNIGSRQQGRLRAGNVIEAEPRREDVLAAIRRAVSDGFRAGLAGQANPYGDGRASGRIVERLKGVELDGWLLLKRFQDIETRRSAQ